MKYNFIEKDFDFYFLCFAFNQHRLVILVVPRNFRVGQPAKPRRVGLFGYPVFTNVPSVSPRCLSGQSESGRTLTGF